MKTSALIGSLARSVPVVMTMAVACSSPNVGKEDALVSPPSGGSGGDGGGGGGGGTGGGGAGGLSPSPDGRAPPDALRPLDAMMDMSAEAARPPGDMMGPPIKQPVGGNCMTGTDCESGKCCAGKCIAVSTCCNCNTTPRCSSGNVLSATCDAQGTCMERVTDCGGRGCTDGRCHVCQPGSAECSGNTLVTCNASGSATTNQNCQFGCNVARKQCNACQPGTQACNGVRRETCKTDGSGYDPGSCNPMCLRMGECCGDLDCGRCGEIYPCRSCDANNRCQMTNSEPSCNTQGTCTPGATEVCRMNGATCEVRKRRDAPCKYQLCRWANVSLEACGLGANKGIPTPVCHTFSFNNPESVHWGTDGACITQVENISGPPYVCLP